MPIYEYTCRACSADFEAILPASRRDESGCACPECGNTQILRKISLMAKPVVKAGGSSTPTEDYSCGAPSCCGGRCAID